MVSCVKNARCFEARFKHKPQSTTISQLLTPISTSISKTIPHPIEPNTKMASKATAKNGKIAAQLGQPGFDREAEGTLYDRPKALKKVPPSLAFAMFPPALGTPLWALGEGGSYLADTMTWSYINHNWETAWSGNLLPGKHTSGLFGPLEFRPKPHAQLGEAVSATWSYNTRRWNITYEVDFSMESARFPESTQAMYSSVPHMADILTCTYLVVQRTWTEAVTGSAARKPNRHCRCAAAKVIATTIPASPATLSCRQQ